MGSPGSKITRSKGRSRLIEERYIAGYTAGGDDYKGLPGSRRQNCRGDKGGGGRRNAHLCDPNLPGARKKIGIGKV